MKRAVYLALVVLLLSGQPIAAQPSPFRDTGEDSFNAGPLDRGRERDPFGSGQSNSLDQYDPTIPQRPPVRRNQPPVRWVAVCPRCRGEISEFRDEVCPHCGYDLSSPAPPPPAASGNGPAPATFDFSAEGDKLLQSPGGHNLILLVLGGLLATFFGVIAWVIRKRHSHKLDREYRAAIRTDTHAVSQMLEQMGKRSPTETAPTPDRSSEEFSATAVAPEFVSAAEREAPPRLPSKGEWLLDRGLQNLEKELARGHRSGRDCRTCRFAGVASGAACPRAFSCGALKHPRAGATHAVYRGLLWFGFVLVLIVIITGALVVFPPKNPKHSMAEFLIVAGPALLGMAALAGGISFAWHFAGIAKIRKQVREAAKAAHSLGLEYCHFRPLSLETGSLALPLLVPGEPNLVQAVMRGQFRGHDVFVAYYEYEYAERYGRGSAAERKMAVVRGAMGKEFHMKIGQLVMMFPEPLAGWPPFHISPRKDLDYLLERNVGEVKLLGHRAAVAKRQYCVASPFAPAGRMFDDECQQFLIEHPGWNVQHLPGRLMLWRGRLDELSAEIVPGNALHLAADLEQAVAWRELLGRKGIVT